MGGGESAAGGGIFCLAGAAEFGALFVPVEDGFANAVHGLLRDHAGALRTGIQIFEDLLGISFEILAALADRLDPFDQMIGHGCFALDAADSRRTAAVCRPILDFLWRK